MKEQGINILVVNGLGKNNSNIMTNYLYEEKAEYDISDVINKLNGYYEGYSQIVKDIDYYDLANAAADACKIFYEFKKC